MKRFLAPVLTVILLSTGASAGIDPIPDCFGVYFDTEGNSVCMSVSPFTPTLAYLILMNPAGPTNGCEFSVTRTGAVHFVLSTTCACAMVDGCTIEGNDYWIVCGSDFPVPASGAVVLVTWMIMLMEPGELLFYIGPSSIPSLPGGLPVVTGSGVLRQCSVASGDVDIPVAGFNVDWCGVGAEASAFGNVKSLFR